VKPGLVTESVGESDVVAREGLDHELVRLFAAQGLPLNVTLREMLNEHYSHRTERRGAGFTQATRHLAAMVNSRTSAESTPDLRMFSSGADVLPTPGDLRLLQALLEREESRILARIIGDLALPGSADRAYVELPVWHEDLKVGTCPLAEKYFLELAAAFVRRKGRVNVLVSSSGQPVLIEKLNLGDDHSCISVAPVVLNGVGLPPGSLFSVRYDPAGPFRANRTLPGALIPLDACSGFRFLRLSTLAVDPQHRERAFTMHFATQVAAGLFAPGEATIEQLWRLAMDQL
jgi:hypothetical protein